MIGPDAHDPDRRPQQLGRAFPVKTGPAPTLATSILAPKLEAMAEAQAVGSTASSKKKSRNHVHEVCVQRRHYSSALKESL